jgi:hypothetical protein
VPTERNAAKIAKAAIHATNPGEWNLSFRPDRRLITTTAPQMSAP